MEKRSKRLQIISAAFYLLAIIMLLIGVHKMTQYRNSEYSPSRNVNAYVGGDAYNYIINGNYATGFFVLSMGSMITGTLFVGLSFMAEEIEGTKARHSVLEERPAGISSNIKKLNTYTE